MGKPTGFMEYPREEMIKDPVPARIKHFKEFKTPQTNTRIRTQAARCMDCGVPFCNSACPVANLIPEFNDLVYEVQWKSAYRCLQSTNNFPEFTGRICPAPCEPACTAAIVDKPIAIKHIELAIIEHAFKKGWVVPRKVFKRSKYKIAIIGSGPAGLAAADNINMAGHLVTVFEKHDRLGGLLTYGIPDFKLEKSVVKRRTDILQKEGIEFVTGCHVGKDYPAEKLLQDFDFICLCCGAEEQKDFNIPGSDKLGVHYAMEYLIQQNNRIYGQKIAPEKAIVAKDKHVVIVGGGDTGADCVGTAIRQGAKSVTQVQLHKIPPLERYSTNPWPKWPKVLQNSSSHNEGCLREFSYLTKEVIGDERVSGLKLEEIIWPKGEIKSGQRNYKLTAKTKIIPCDLLISALGFKHTVHKGLVQDLNLETDARGNLEVTKFKSSNPQIFAAGDMVEGANLVVTAIASGRKMAAILNKQLEQLGD